MKRIISLLLVLTLCLWLCACNGGETTDNTTSAQAPSQTTKATEAATLATEPAVDILGEWVSVKDNGYTLTFLEDGTCFYTGSLVSPGMVIGGMVVVGGLVPGSNETQNSESPENQSYQYDFDRERSIITIFSALTKSYNVADANGKTVIATIEGEPTFVRNENYEEFHTVCVEQFYDKGEEGRVELMYGETYQIQNGICMTVSGYVEGETADMSGKFPLFLQIALENTSEKGIYVRNPGGVVDGVLKPMFSEITVKINLQSLKGMGSWGGSVLPIAKRTNETMTDSDSTLYLEPGAKEEYYLKLDGVYLQAVEQEPTYVVLIFENVELFYNVSAAVAGE